MSVAAAESVDVAAVREAAAGRWTEILLVLGIPRELLNGKHQPCPWCGGKDRFRYTDRSGHGVYFCNQCGANDGFHFLQRFHNWTFGKAIEEVQAALGTPLPKIWAKSRTDPRNRSWLWRSSKPLRANDPVAQYLQGRGITHGSPALRYAPELPHVESDQRHPAMIALFCDPNGRAATLHRTYLADVEPRKKFMPGTIPAGGAVRLSDPYEVMGVAEGIETALSASVLFSMPVWATCSEGCLRRWAPPSAARIVTVFGDNDENYVGQKAAYTLAHRLVIEFKLTVYVKIPLTPGWDWNDELLHQNLAENIRDLEDAKERLASQSLPDPDGAA